jgi:hypothetical protein
VDRTYIYNCKIKRGGYGCRSRHGERCCLWVESRKTCLPSGGVCVCGMDILFGVDDLSNVEQVLLPISEINHCRIGNRLSDRARTDAPYVCVRLSCKVSYFVLILSVGRPVFLTARGA